MVSSNDGDKKVKILIEATKMLSDNCDGIHRYVNELVSAMAALVDGDENHIQIDIFVGRGLFFSIADIQDIFGKKSESSLSNASSKNLNRLHTILLLRDACRRQIEDRLPERLYQIRKSIKDPFHSLLCKLNPRLHFKYYDVVHLTQPQSYIHFQHCQPSMITTVHDLTHLHFPQFHLQENIDNANHGMRLAIEKKSAFIAVSGSTRQDLLSAYPAIEPNRVHVVHEACDSNRFKPSNNHAALAKVRLKYGIPEHPFFLSLSTIEPRKNLLNAIKAFLLMIREHPELSMNFIIAGKKGWKHDTLMKTVARWSDRVIFTGFVDDCDLPILYSAAVAFIYVSFYEGFGLPPLEAMSCGIPIVYGNNSAMLEVIGKGGLAANPNDIVEIKEKYKKLVLDKSARDLTAKTALKRSRQFSWKRAAQQTLDIYTNMVISNSGRIKP